MKIERINDNQIRCILTKEDLEARQIKFSELTYGSEKATSLFRDVMMEANQLYGFEPQNHPLMIEAVPMQSGMIVFLITKVASDADSRDNLSAMDLFGDDGMSGDDTFHDKENAASATIRIGGPISSLPSLGQTIRDLFQEMLSLDGSQPAAPSSNEKRPAPAREERDRIFVFDSLSDVIDLALAVTDLDLGSNTLYKDASDGRFYLLLVADTFIPAVYKQLVTRASDFSSSEAASRGLTAHMDEMYEVILREHALDKLGNMKK